jgi:hypothetical protein
VLKYLIKIARFRITYSRDRDIIIVGYTYIDYVADKSRKSIIGYIFTYAGETPTERLVG